MSLPLLLEETLGKGVIPATEMLTAEHALMVVHALEHYGDDADACLARIAQSEPFGAKENLQNPCYRPRRDHIHVQKPNVG